MFLISSFVSDFFCTEFVNTEKVVEKSVCLTVSFLICNVLIGLSVLWITPVCTGERQSITRLSVKSLNPLSTSDTGNFDIV